MSSKVIFRGLGPASEMLTDELTVRGFPLWSYPSFVTRRPLMSYWIGLIGRPSARLFLDHWAGVSIDRGTGLFL